MPGHTLIHMMHLRFIPESPPGNNLHTTQFTLDMPNTASQQGDQRSPALQQVVSMQWCIQGSISGVYLMYFGCIQSIPAVNIQSGLKLSKVIGEKIF